MNKGIFSLLFIALFASAQCESFMRIPFENGKVSSRSLAATSTAAFTTIHPNNVAAAVVFPADFKTFNNITADTVTDMLIVLSQSYSGIFFNYVKDFTSLNCDAPTCTMAKNEIWVEGHPSLRYKGSPSNIHMQVKSGDTVAWECQDQLAVFSSYSSTGAADTQQFADYIRSPGVYGTIGLGIDNGANGVNGNFKTEFPIFSVKTSRTRIGSIVFGNDGTSTKNPVKLTADKNWRVAYDSISMLGTVTKVDSSRIGLISFDLNIDGIYTYAEIYNAIFIPLSTKYKFTSESDAAKKPFGIYEYSYSGSLSDLPDIIIKNGDKELLKLPSTVYMRYDNNLKKFGFLIQSKGYYFFTADGSTKSVSGFIFGNQVLAQYYTVFEATKDGQTVTLNEAPLNDWPSGGSSSGGSKGWIIGVVAVVGLAAVGYIVFKNKAANKLSEHLNPK